MSLPFTPDQFFDLFAEYNHAHWPAAAALWIASLIAAALVFRGRPPHSQIAALLAAHWAWSGLGYHLAYFTRINPAAVLFGVLCVAEAVGIAWLGVVRAELTFAPPRSRWTPVAWALVAYGLAYPAISAALGGSVWRAPLFAVPCPTMIFTAGMLMLASGPVGRLAIIPIAWSVIGGSAAWTLGVAADIALPAAGLLLATYCLSRGARALHLRSA